MTPRIASAATTVLLAAALLSGCAAQTRTAPLAAAPTGPQVAAQADAAALLVAFRPPPGATRLPAKPTAVPSLLDSPAMLPTDQGLVVRTEWWTVGGTPEQALAWVDGHESVASSGSGRSADGAGGTVAYKTFERTPTAQLDTRTLLVSAVAYGSRTLLRVDAEDVPVPPRPTGLKVPGDVSRLVVRAQPGLGTVGSPAPWTVLATVTDAQQLRRISGLLDGLPEEVPGVRSCPADTGGRLRLDFYAGTATTPVATAVGDHSGCQGVTLTVKGVPGSADLAGNGFQAELLALLHLRFPQTAR